MYINAIVAINVRPLIHAVRGLIIFEKIFHISIMCPQSTLFSVTFSHFLGIAIKIPFLGETATALRHTSLASTVIRQ